ncbi:putative ribonuclease H-like domain-containing protein [Tanacetum coccineum]
MVPRTVLTRSGPISVNTTRLVNTVQLRTVVNNAGPIKNIINNAYSTARRHFNKITTTNNSNFTKKVNIVKGTRVNTSRPKVVLSAVKGNKGNVVKASAYPRNRSYLTDYEEINGGFVAFRGNSKGGKITGKGKIRTSKLDFKDVYFVKELKFNHFSVSQMCDKKNSILFTDTECVVLSQDFKLTDENHVLLKVPKKDDMYSIDVKNVVPQRRLTCLFAKATPYESNHWHRRLGHVNFKTMNKLVRGNLVRGLPSKLFEINQTCVACQKGKQHRASCKTKTVSSISQPLQMLHIDLFGLTFVKSLMKKIYCLVVTDDFSRFSWIFFLASKDESSEILKTFITGIENLIDLRVKVIRCDNGTEFKNRVMNQFCEMKGIKREFSVARTPQQNGVAERKNKTLIEAARTMLADSKLPTTFWAEFSEDTPNIAGRGPNWLFDIDALTNLMNYKPVVARNQSNANAGIKACNDAGKTRMETVPGKDYILLPLWTQDPPFSSSSKDSPDAGFKPSRDEEKKDVEDPGNESGNLTEGKDSEVPSTEEPKINQEKDDNINSTNNINTDSDGNSTNNVNVVSSTVNVAGLEVNVVDPKTSIEFPNDLNMPELEDIVYSDDNEDVGAEADMNNLDAFMHVSPIPTTRIHKDHPVDQIIGDLNSAPQTRRMTKNLKEHEAMQEEILQFKLQHVWTLMDLPNGKRTIGTKWVYKNKKDERVSRIKAIRLFLAYASFKDFVVYQMDVKSDFLYGKIKEEVYVCQPPGFEDPDFLERVYKVEKVKTVNGEVQIQALVDKNKVIIIETSVRSDLQLEDAEGTKCLPNATIFEQLTLIGITMASAVICLAINQKFNFSKYIFDNMVKNLEGEVKFLMYQRQGKDFSGRDTPLFPIMIVQAQEQKTKTFQAVEITELKERVKRLEKKEGSRTHRIIRLYKVGRSARVVSSKDKGLGDQEDASKQGRKIDEINQDAKVTLVDETQGRYGDNLMFDTGVLDMAEKEVDMAEKDVSTSDPVTTTGEVVTTVNVVVSTAEVTTDSTTTTTIDELTLAQTLIEIKAAKPKARGVIV